jgi:hypothetical protein
MVNRKLTQLLPAAIMIVTACSFLETATSVRTDAFPGIAIECQGDAPLAPEQCVAWGVELLEGSEELVPNTTRLVLTASADANRRCSADFFDAAGRVFATEATRCPRA